MEARRVPIAEVEEGRAILFVPSRPIGEARSWCTRSRGAPKVSPCRAHKPSCDCYRPDVRAGGPLSDTGRGRCPLQSPHRRPFGTPRRRRCGESGCAGHSPPVRPPVGAFRFKNQSVPIFGPGRATPLPAWLSCIGQVVPASKITSDAVTLVQIQAYKDGQHKVEN